MSNNNKTGPIGNGPKDGRGRRSNGRGQDSKRKGSGAKTGGQKGSC